jgi:hypothetical protein
VRNERNIAANMISIGSSLPAVRPCTFCAAAPEMRLLSLSECHSRFRHRLAHFARQLAIHIGQSSNNRARPGTMRQPGSISFGRICGRA